MALAGKVIASHYAAPVARKLGRTAMLQDAPNGEGSDIASLDAGAPFHLLDCRGGWAWGYGGEERLVGYLPEEALASLE